MPQNPTLPPKWPRSGVTFHLKSRRHKEEEKSNFKMKQSFSPILQEKVFIQNDRAYIASLKKPRFLI